MSGGPTLPGSPGISSTAPDNISMDFDILAPPKRIVKMGGELIDVSFIPTIIALEIMKFSGFDQEEFKPEMFEQIAEVTAKLCDRSNPKIDKNWILQNTDPITLMKFLLYAIKSLTATMQAENIITPGEEPAEGGDVKN